MKRWRLILTLTIALTAGLVAGRLTWPTVQAEIALKRLFSDDASQRRRAQVQLYGAVSDRVAQRIVAAMETADDDVFLDAAGVLDGSGRWTSHHVSVEWWCRRWELVLSLPPLDPGDDIESAMGVLMELETVPAASMRTHGDRAAALSLWLRLITWPDVLMVREPALIQAAEWYGKREAERAVAPALEDESPRLRRLAWLLMGHIDPTSGYTADWANEPPEVAAAILWATTATNPDDASPLLHALDASPGPTRALPWLLSRSDDPRAVEAMEGLRLDGNQAAMLVVAERTGVDPSGLPAPQSAWLGLGEAPAETVLQRWHVWRQRPGTPVPGISAHTSASHVLLGILDDPVAEDGSVWAAVLLAERLLSAEEAAALAQRWLDELEDGPRIAGLLLAGLLGVEADRIESIRNATRSVGVKRAARLALLMHRAPHDADKSDERFYAWRLLNSDEIPGRLEVLLSLAAVGDESALRTLLERPNENASAHLLSHAWLIERFLSEPFALVAPLHPWEEEVAALQLDIMKTGLILGRDEP